MDRKMEGALTKEMLNERMKQFSVGDIVLVPEKLASLSKDVTGKVICITDRLLIVECQYSKIKITESFDFTDARDLIIKDSVKKRVYKEKDINDIIKYIAT